MSIASRLFLTFTILQAVTGGRFSIKHLGSLRDRRENLAGEALVQGTMGTISDKTAFAQPVFFSELRNHWGGQEDNNSRDRGTFLASDLAHGTDLADPKAIARASLDKFLERLSFDSELVASCKKSLSFLDPQKQSPDAIFKKLLDGRSKKQIKAFGQALFERASPATNIKIAEFRGSDGLGGFVIAAKREGVVFGIVVSFEAE